MNRILKKAFSFKNLNSRIALGFIVILSILAGWILRSGHIAGDGLMIVRVTEAGRWLVNNELIGQVIVQAGYQLGQFFSLTAFEILQIISIFCGTLALVILCVGGRKYFLIPYNISCLIFFSTGYLLYSTGHTEYYPIVLPVLFLYGFYGLAYLRGQKKYSSVIVVYFVGVSLHLALLIILPSIVTLPYLKKNYKDYQKLIWLFIGIFILFIFREFPQFTGYQPVQLGSGWSVLPWFEYGGMKWRYAFFSWGHWLDWVYGNIRRSWLLWPFILMQIYLLKKTSWNTERFFLLLYTLCFTFWALLWHPDLGIETDWDLFALETAPAILLLYSCLNGWQISKMNKLFIIVITVFGLLFQMSYVIDRAELPANGYGSVIIKNVNEDNVSLTIHGKSYPLMIHRIKSGRYPAKIIDQTERKVIEFYFVVQENKKTQIDYHALIKEPH